MTFSAKFFNVHLTLVTFKAPLTHKSLVTLCAQVALIRVAGILVLDEFLA